MPVYLKMQHDIYLPVLYDKAHPDFLRGNSDLVNWFVPTVCFNKPVEMYLNIIVQIITLLILSDMLKKVCIIIF